MPEELKGIIELIFPYIPYALAAIAAIGLLAIILIFATKKITK